MSEQVNADNGQSLVQAAEQAAARLLRHCDKSRSRSMELGLTLEYAAQTGERQAKGALSKLYNRGMSNKDASAIYSAELFSRLAQKSAEILSADTNILPD